MAVIREHLAAKGLGLHNDLQTEHSIVGNNPFITMFDLYATPEQRAMIEGSITGEIRTSFGLTEPDHGSDATFMETRAVRSRERRPRLADQRREDVDHRHARGQPLRGLRPHLREGRRRRRHHLLPRAGRPRGREDRGVSVDLQHADRPSARQLHRRLVAEDALCGESAGPGAGQSFVHQNRIRQAASSLGAAVYCIDESVKYARGASRSGRPLADNQAIQWPLVELATQCEMLRLLIRKTAWEMDQAAAQGDRAARSPTRSRCATTGRTGCAARRPTGPCRCTAASATRATSRSSTSIATTAATASPRARRRSRCARSPPSCSAIMGPRRGKKEPDAAN